jgi:hypothetical protein
LGVISFRQLYVGVIDVSGMWHTLSSSGKFIADKPVKNRSVGNLFSVESAVTTIGLAAIPRV